MKKLLCIALILILAFSFINAAETTTNKSGSSFCNNVIVSQWKDMKLLTITGISPVPLILKTEAIEAITIDSNGSLNIIGKMDANGNQLDLWQVNFFATQVLIKTKKSTDTKTKAEVIDKNMIVLTPSSTGKAF